MAGVQAFDFESPDETRTPAKTRVDVVRTARISRHVRAEARTRGLVLASTALGPRPTLGAEHQDVCPRARPASCDGP